MKKLMTYLLFIFLGLTSCQQKQIVKLPKEISTKVSKEIRSAKDIVQHSIQYHDPMGNWNKFMGEVHFKTQYWNKKGEIELSSSSISFDNAKQVFISKSKISGNEVLGFVSPDTCYKSVIKELSEKDQLALQKKLTCESVIFSRDYYSFLIGMPMKLNDSGAIINDTIFERTYDGILYDVAKVTYEPLDKNPIWYFYFDKKDHSFQLCKFTSREDENKGGEYIIYNQEFTNHQGIKLKGQQVWLYNTVTLDTLAVDDLKFIEHSRN